MADTHANVINVYNPANQTKSELLANYVVRIQEFKEIIRVVKSDMMYQPSRHFIVQGQRGSGKTTILLRLYYEVESDPHLNKWLIPIRFDEEQYQIRTLFKFWESIAIYLEDELDNGFYGIYDEMRGYLDDRDYEQNCFRIIKKYLDKEQRRLILFADNFGDMLNKFQKDELRRLYQVLAHESLIRVIGSSSVPIENYISDTLLIDLFSVIQLEELDHRETTDLLLKLGDYYDQKSIRDIVRKEKGRIEALRRLTGGIPRTIVLLYEIFIDNESGDSFRDLEAILDRVTPLYKHRMDDLSPQQQEIVHAIAMNWDAVGVKEISHETRMESKAVSSQLKQLEMSRIITKIRTNIKNHLYQLNERFFNIWYLMRYGRKKDRNKILWLVRFLENWCDREELIQRAEKHLLALKRGSMYERHALYMTEALSHTAIPEDLQYLMIRETRRLLHEKNKDLLPELSKSDRELYNAFAHNYAEKNYETALKNLLDIRNKNEFVQGMLGFLYEIHVHDLVKAERYYLSAVEMGNKSMIYNLANLYETEMHNYPRAEKYYLEAAKNGNDTALFRLGLMYEDKINDIKKAEYFYQQAVKAGNTDAMNSLGLIYQNFYRDYQKAERYYLQAVAGEHVEAMNNLAWLYFIRKESKQAALALLNRAKVTSDELTNAYVCSMIFLWNNLFEQSFSRARQFIEDEEMLTSFSKGVQPYLMLLIAKKQYMYIYDLFTRNKCNIRDKYKPIYYALMYFMQDRLPDEYRRMGTELKQTVDEIVEQIQVMQAEYA